MTQSARAKPIVVIGRTSPYAAAPTTTATATLTPAIAYSRLRRLPSRPALPRGVHADAEQREERQHRHEEHEVEVRRADRDLAELERVHEQRIERAEQDQAERGDQERIVEEHETLARRGLEARPRT